MNPCCRTVTTLSLLSPGMRVLSQVSSASSCERNWSAQGHIQTKISNKLSAETTEKLVYVYLNSKMAATVSDSLEPQGRLFCSWVLWTSWTVDTNCHAAGTTFQFQAQNLSAKRFLRILLPRFGSPQSDVAVLYCSILCMQGWCTYSWRQIASEFECVKAPIHDDRQLVKLETVDSRWFSSSISCRKLMRRVALHTSTASADQGSTVQHLHHRAGKNPSFALPFSTLAEHVQTPEAHTLPQTWI